MYEIVDHLSSEIRRALEIALEEVLVITGVRMKLKKVRSLRYSLI